ncbi:UNVERIFIED_CONTAM: hypothetical protein FKN15_047309 [Acipenser sinensis]
MEDSKWFTCDTNVQLGDREHCVSTAVSVLFSFIFHVLNARLGLVKCLRNQM